MAQDPPPGTIEALSVARNPFTIPRPNREIKLWLLQSFCSDLARTSNPFSNTAFEEAEVLANISTRNHHEFEETSSSTTDQSNHNLSIGLKASVGCSFLNVSVSGSYAQAVADNLDENKCNKRASYVDSLISCQKKHKFSTEAMEIFKKDPRAFREKFGDFYVAGFQLGADCGIMLSQKDESHGDAEVAKIKVSLNTFFGSAESVLADTNSEFEKQKSSLSVIAYDTLTDSTTNTVSAKEVSQYTRWLGSLKSRFAEQAKTSSTLAGIRDHPQKIGKASVEELLKGNLITGVLLEPFSTLPISVTG